MPDSFLTPEEERLKVLWDYSNVLATTERKGRAKGRVEGRAEGRKEGEAIGIQKTAKKMKEEGMDVKTISKLTDLPIEEIEKL